MSRIVGYPIVFSPSVSVDLGGFRESIDARALDGVLSSHADVVALFGHENLMPLGRRSARTLTLQKDSTGLLIDLEVSDDVSFARDAIDIIRRGDASGGSFGFIALDESWELRNGTPHRTLLDMSLREVSIAVAWPAYKDTRLTLRGTPERSRDDSKRKSIERERVETLLRLAR